MMLPELKSLIEEDIKLTQEYNDYLKTEIHSILTAIGQHHLEHLNCFNLGYKMALERVLLLIERTHG